MGVPGVHNGNSYAFMGFHGRSRSFNSVPGVFQGFPLSFRNVPGVFKGSQRCYREFLGVLEDLGGVSGLS